MIANTNTDFLISKYGGLVDYYKEILGISTLQPQITVFIDEINHDLDESTKQACIIVDGDETIDYSDQFYFKNELWNVFKIDEFHKDNVRNHYEIVLSSNAIATGVLQTPIYILPRDYELTYKSCDTNFATDATASIEILEYEVETMGRIKKLDNQNLNDIITHKLTVGFDVLIEINQMVSMNGKFFEIESMINVNEANTKLELYLIEVGIADTSSY